jgi:hypothetical protein
MLLINVYHRGQILKTSHGTDYDIQAACTFSADEAINLRDLKSHISARINTAPAGSSDFFIAYWGLFLMKFGE